MRRFVEAFALAQILISKLHVFSNRRSHSLSERVKSGHLWTPQIRPFRRPETGVEFYFTASCVCKVVWILVRQLRGPHFSTCA